MNRLRQIDDKIRQARARRDFIAELKLRQERAAIIKEAKEKERTTLKDCMEGFTVEEQNQATLRVIYCIAIADLLYGATMDVAEFMKRRFDIDELPLLDEMRMIVKKLHGIVKTIDDVGCDYFSDNYADVVDEVETRYEATMKNYIFNRLLKSAREKYKFDKI